MTKEAIKKLKDDGSRRRLLEEARGKLWDAKNATEAAREDNCHEEKIATARRALDDAEQLIKEARAI